MMLIISGCNIYLMTVIKRAVFRGYVYVYVGKGSRVYARDCSRSISLSIVLNIIGENVTKILGCLKLELEVQEPIGKVYGELMV